MGIEKQMKILEKWLDETKATKEEYKALHELWENSNQLRILYENLDINTILYENLDINTINLALNL